MITGDAEDTAVAVASAVGFFDPSHHRTLSGAEIERMSPSELEVRLTAVPPQQQCEPCAFFVYGVPVRSSSCT